MKKLLKILIVTAFIFSLSTTVTLAQSDEIQEANTEVQESTNELIEAKDEESPFTLSQRIKAFKDVINLSLTEAKDIKVKLLSLDLSNENIEKWREGVIENINEAISHYEEVNEFVNNNEEDLTEQEVVDEAKEFKQWRQENYIPVYEQARNFILMNKEEEIIKTAENRWNKIQKDVETLKNAGIGSTEELNNMLEKSKGLIDEGKNQNQKAFDLFMKSIVNQESNDTQATSTATTTSTSTVTSTDENSSTTTGVKSTTTEDLDQVNTSNTSTMTSTTSNQTTTTEVNEMSLTTSTQSTTTEGTSTTTPDSLNVSIRGLVGSSLQNIRESYQVFIEMSNFVRELLR